MSFSTAYAQASSPHDRDLATLSNYRDIRTTHIDLAWAIDWEAKTIGGTATLTLEATNDVDEVVLDTSYLDVTGVEVGGKAAVRVELARKANIAPAIPEDFSKWSTSFGGRR